MGGRVVGLEPVHPVLPCGRSGARSELAYSAQKVVVSARRLFQLCQPAGRTTSLIRQKTARLPAPQV